MKTKLLFLSLIAASSFALANDCTPHIRYVYESHGNKVIGITLEGQTEKSSIYSVRGNLHSGDFLEQVTANTKTCSIESIQTIWSE